MEESPYTIDETLWAFRANITLMCFLSISLCTVGFLLIELSIFKPKVTCLVLSSLQDAQAELPTHPGLDRDHDGKLCEEQFPNQ